MNKVEINHHPGKLWHLAARIFFALFSNVKLAKKFRNLGEIANYSLLLRSKFKLTAFQVNKLTQNNRLDLFKIVFQDAHKVDVFEFGVANGFVPNWLLNNYSIQIGLYKGFDRFVGLPRSWRDLEEGTFTNDGNVPEIYDNRFQFIVGNVEDTFSDNFLESPALESIRLYIFDLDIYEPTFFLWKKIMPKLNIGDYLYFDEAFDIDEYKVWYDNLNITQDGFQIEVAGVTPISLLLRVANKVK
jgi:hypothetical protein